MLRQRAIRVGVLPDHRKTTISTWLAQLWAVFLLAWSVTTPAHAGNLLQNGSFETPALSSGAYQGRPANVGWTFSGSSGIQSNGSVWGATRTQDGSQTAVLQMQAGLSQPFEVAAGGSYVLTFRASQRSCCAMSYGQQINVSIDGTVIGQVTPPSSTTYTSYQYVLQLSAGTHTLAFAGTATSDMSAFLDAVAVEPAPLLQNGGFETPYVGMAAQGAPGAANWTFSGSSGIQGNSSVFGAATAPEGTQTVWIQGTGSIAQTVNLNTAGNYLLTFRAALRACCTTPYAQPLQIKVNGTLIGQVAPTTTTSYTAYSFPLQLSAGSHTLTITGTSSVLNTAFLDTITLTGVLSVDMAAPANNSTRSSSTPIALSATPTEPGDTIAKVDFYRGTALIGTATSAPYTFHWSNATPGTYTITAKATDVLGTTAVSAPIALTVYDAPTIDLTGPAATSPLLAPATATLSATAAVSGAGNTVTQVAFYNGTAFLGSSTTAPYVLTWNAIPAGSYSVTAVVTDSVGGSATSRALGVTVIDNLPPTVSLQASPTTATAPATIALTANATDADGTIAGVAFYNGTQLLGTVEQAPYRYTWSNVVPGNYRLTAKATDQVGGSTVSSPVTVQVSGAPATVYYIDSDQVNTPRLITDASNTIVWRWDNDEPFGNNVPAANNGFEFNLRFPGQYWDWETGLHYNYFRDYDPATGRYIESDPIGLAGGINTFTYVANQPTKYFDRLGLWATDAHDYFIDQSFPNLPPEQRDIIKEGSAYIDTPKYQDDFHSGLHGMTSGAMNEAQARAQLCKFVKDNLSRSNAAKAQGDPRYLYHLGMALHPIMDYTSPAHRGWQTWHGASDASKHGPWPTSLENIKIAKQPRYTKETVDLIKKALAGELPCECQ